MITDAEIDAVLARGCTAFLGPFAGHVHGVGVPEATHRRALFRCRHVATVPPRPMSVCLKAGVKRGMVRIGGPLRAVRCECAARSPPENSRARPFPRGTQAGHR